MSNAKRAIMVPIMTLAVCAIAMVGLGFAITTTVTSNANQVEKLTVDMDSDAATLAGQKNVDTNSVENLLSFSIKSDKITTTTTNPTEEGGSTTTTTTTVEYTLEGGCSYIKVFGNVTGTKLTAEYATVDFDGESGTNPNMTLTITDMGTTGATAGASQTLAVGSSIGVDVIVGNVYKVQITTYDTMEFISGVCSYTGPSIPDITTGTFGLKFTVTA